MRGTRIVRLAGLLALAASVAACSFSFKADIGESPTPAVASQDPQSAGLRFGYTAIGRDNYINQTLTIYNDRPEQAAVPTLAIQPLDSKNAALAGVSVESLFGVLTGELLVQPPGGYDILRFSGDRAGDVRQMKVTVVSVRWIPDSRAQILEPTLQFIAADNSSVTKFDDFTSVVVTNLNGFEVRAAIVYIVWTDPDLPGPQQARLTARFPGPFTLAANGTITVPIGDAVRSVMAARGDQAAVSVKIYPVP